MAIPTVDEGNSTKLDEVTKDELSTDIANKVYTLQEDKKNQDRILKDIRKRKENEDLNKSNVTNDASSLDAALPNANNDENLPNIATETLKERCGDGKCSLSDSGIVEVLMPKNTVIASCPNCSLGIPHNHAIDIDECPNCNSTKNFRKSKYNPEREKIRKEKRDKRGKR